MSRGYEGCLHGNRTRTTVHPILTASIYDIQSIDDGWCGQSPRAHSACAAGFPWRLLSSYSDECLSRACIACRRYAIDSNPYEPPTRQEARSADAPFTGVRVHSAHKGEDTGGRPVSREETRPLSIRTPYLRPLIALSRRFRSCAHGGAGFAEDTGGLYPGEPNYQGASAASALARGGCCGERHRRCASYTAGGCQ